MLSLAERTQIRAALTLWLQIEATSRTHPADLPLCNVIFLAAKTLPLSEERMTSLLQALEHPIIYVSPPVVAVQYEVSKIRLRRELDRIDAIPVPGTRLYMTSDVIHAVNRIKERDRDRGRT